MIEVFNYRFTAVGQSPSITMGGPRGATMTVAASADPTITFDVTVELQVSNDGNTWVAAGTVNLTGTDIIATGYATLPAVPWKFVRVAVTNIVGTGAYAEIALGI